MGKPARSKRIDLEACEALSGANSKDIAVMCLRDAAAIDMVKIVWVEVFERCVE